jgi:phosphatidylinositol glycan class F
MSSPPVSPVGEGDEKDKEKEKEKEKRKLPLRAGKLGKRKNQAHAAGLSPKLTVCTSSFTDIIWLI